MLRSGSGRLLDLPRALEGQGIENGQRSILRVSRSTEGSGGGKDGSSGCQRLAQGVARVVERERGMLSVVRVPSVQEEDNRRLHRERERLLKERGAHSARIQSLLVAQGIRLPIDSELVERLETMSGADWGLRWERTGKSGDWTGG
ncbi:MAG: hypothetical protein ACRER2_11330 [Methylococcales bacterium]